MVRKAGDTGTEFVTNDGPRFPDDGREYGERADGSNGANGQEEAYVMGEVKAGTLVLIHGNLLHKSERNLSNRSRFIYTFHIIESADGVEYDSRNWLQPPAEGFTRLYD